MMLFKYFCKKIRMSISEKLAALLQEKSSKNELEGSRFLENNKIQEGVQCLPSGLQYKIITQTERVKPTINNQVTCHYHGTCIDGTVFDSSVQRGTPATFPLHRVIQGWTEGLQLMSAGSTYIFYIPPHLAYGAQQISKEIGPNTTLIFEVELLSIS